MSRSLRYGSGVAEFETAQITSSHTFLNPVVGKHGLFAAYFRALLLEWRFEWSHMWHELLA